jgi:hypothetical protein
VRPCPDSTPVWFIGLWRDWHRGHGCSNDDGLPQSAEAVAEISQHASNKGTGFLTDAQLSHLRARTTSGDTLLLRALNELHARRAEVQQRTAALTEALDIFDSTWCTELGHCPTKEQFARMDELRRSVSPGAPADGTDD